MYLALSECREATRYQTLAGAGLSCQPGEAHGFREAVVLCAQVCDAQ